MAYEQGRLLSGWATATSFLSSTLVFQASIHSQTVNQWLAHLACTMCKLAVYRCLLHNLWWYTEAVKSLNSNQVHQGLLRTTLALIMKTVLEGLQQDHKLKIL